LLLEFAAGLGVDLEACLGDAGIDRLSLADPDAEILALQELALIEKVVEQVDDPAAAGLEAGTRYRLTTYGIYSYALLASRTVRDAFTIAMQFVDLTYALTRVSADVSADAVLVSYDDLDVPEPVRRFVLCRDMAAALTIWREGIGQHVVPLRVTMRMPAPRDAARFEDVFGRAPEYDAPRNTITMDPQLLDLALPQASELTAKMCQAQCVALLARRQARRGVSGQVRDLLLEHARRMPTQEDVAGRLHISVRTLRRRLAAEGTTFRALVEDTRHFLAEELLGSGRLTVEQVADRVGYSEASSFVHAFTRRRGIAPRRWARERTRPRVDASA
jgi:AraC-like DNA-binding protein